MYSIGDTVFYGAYGVCVIEDIQDHTFSGQKKLYYILKSHHHHALKLYHPVETEHSQLTPIASKQKAKLILDTFKNAPDQWIERATERAKIQQEILETKNHLQIAQMMNTILRKQVELELEQKKLATQDSQLLKQVSPILLQELAVSLAISPDEVMVKIEQLIHEHR